MNLFDRQQIVEPVAVTVGTVSVDVMVLPARGRAGSMRADRFRRAGCQFGDLQPTT